VTDVVERFAPAKVNLALHVVGRRPDGYHELDTLVAFADVGDRIRVRTADALTLSVSGPFSAHAPAGEDNLVLKAARLLTARCNAPGGAAIELEKHLPAGAGFGGGSADAAAALHALNRLWGLGLPGESLAELGEALGADVPMCVAGRTLRARGRGEALTLVEGWPALPLVLVWPGEPVSTAAVFAALARWENPPLPPFPAPAGLVAAAEWLSGCRNDLEEPAAALAPAIGAALEGLRETEGCLLARMSGSGSGCFGLYGDSSAAAVAAASLRTAAHGWWIEETTAR
jgi:4-diphosphocytidyl-2-C-methyl-D-erythritol kinase